MFDIERKGSGTREWSEHSFNIGLGCANNCLYCYARADALRYKRIQSAEEWPIERLTKNAHIKSFPKKDGVIMFPTTHDITPFYLPHFVRVAKIILEAGNRLLIVTKPRPECIEKVTAELLPWKDQILFRFTIGSLDAGVTAYWEPGAPSPEERVHCLYLASRLGYGISVSIEPMLEGATGTIAVVGKVRRWVTETIWIGKMNAVRQRALSADPGRITEIEELQSDAKIIYLYQFIEVDPMIRWKDSIRKVVDRCSGGRLVE